MASRGWSSMAGVEGAGAADGVADGAADGAETDVAEAAGGTSADGARARACASDVAEPVGAGDGSVQAGGGAKLEGQRAVMRARWASAGRVARRRRRSAAPGLEPGAHPAAAEHSLPFSAFLFPPRGRRGCPRSCGSKLGALADANAAAAAAEFAANMWIGG